MRIRISVKGLIILNFKSWSLRKSTLLKILPSKKKSTMKLREELVSYHLVQGILPE